MGTSNPPAAPPALDYTNFKDVVFNGIDLNRGLIWQDRFQFTTQASSVERTVGGRQAIWVQQLLAGRPITLTATNDQGWLTKAQVDALQALADAGAASYTLLIDDVVYVVRFRFHEPPVLDMQPLIPRNNPEDTDYFIGTIKLMTA